MRNFLSSALMWFVVFMALRIIIDLLVNMHQFAKKDQLFEQTLSDILTYYTYQPLVYFTELGGIIIIASATFTLAMMNRTNELTAMLASGVSLHRVIWPIVICSVLLSGLIVVDQEFLMPRYGDKLIRDRDDAQGKESFEVRLITDGDNSVWYGENFKPGTHVMDSVNVILRDKDFTVLGRISGDSARPATMERNGQTVRGWAFTNGVFFRLNPPHSWPIIPRCTQVWTGVGPAQLLAGVPAEAQKSPVPIHAPEAMDESLNMTVEAQSFLPDPPDAAHGDAPRGGTLTEPRFTFRHEDGKEFCTYAGSTARWKQEPGHGGFWEIPDGYLFLPTDLTVEYLVLRQSSDWMEFMSSADLRNLLKMKRVPDPRRASLACHVRFTDPLNNLIMLLLGLPFILSRERNIKASTGLCLLMVGTFYAFIYICRYLGLPPTLAAWMPILIFGPISAVMLDSVKT